MNGERCQLPAAVNRRAQLIPVLRFFGEEMNASGAPSARRRRSLSVDMATAPLA